MRINSSQADFRIMFTLIWMWCSNSYTCTWALCKASKMAPPSISSIVLLKWHPRKDFLLKDDHSYILLPIDVISLEKKGPPWALNSLAIGLFGIDHFSKHHQTLKWLVYVRNPTWDDLYALWQNVAHLSKKSVYILASFFPGFLLSLPFVIYH